MIVRSLSDAMPEGFPFYHLGSVSRVPDPLQTSLLDLARKNNALGFTLTGDSKYFLAIFYDRDLNGMIDPSVCAEIGNILASRIAENLGAWPTPPQPLSAAKLQRILPSLREDGAVFGKYVHSHDGRMIDLPTALLPLQEEGEIGHA